LYCIDPENEAVIFAELPEDERPEDAPFYYAAQYDKANGSVRMPWATFHEIAHTIPEPEGGVIFVQSDGRCGSTLLSKAFAAVPDVLSLSEPDELTQMIGMRTADGSADHWLSHMIFSSVKWRCKARHGSPAKFVAIKTRSEVTRLADLMCAQFPQAKNLFIYRDGVSWAKSIYRTARVDAVFDDPERNRQMQEGWGKMMPLVTEYAREDEPLNPIQIRTLCWVTNIEDYLNLVEGGVPFCAVRYEELVASPVPILHQLFDYCGISNVDWAEIEVVLGRDSQEGSIYDREVLGARQRVLPEWLQQSAIDTIATRPRIKTPGVILPGTIGV
ncbi:MAG: sulfotransferase, partial [Armatimonadota bacterium]